MILTFKNLSLLEKSFCLSVFFTWNFWAKTWHLEISKSPIIQKHVILEYSFHKIQMILHILKMQMQMTGKVLTTEGWKQGEIRGYCTKKNHKEMQKKIDAAHIAEKFRVSIPRSCSMPLPWCPQILSEPNSWPIWDKTKGQSDVQKLSECPPITSVPLALFGLAEYQQYLHLYEDNLSHKDVRNAPASPMLCCSVHSVVANWCTTPGKNPWIWRTKTWVRKRASNTDKTGTSDLLGSNRKEKNAILWGTLEYFRYSTFPNATNRDVSTTKQRSIGGHAWDYFGLRPILITPKSSSSHPPFFEVSSRHL